MAGRFISTYSVVLTPPMYVSYTLIRGDSVHTDTVSSCPGGGFTTLSVAAAWGVPAALAPPLGMDPSSSAVHQQLVKAETKILVQELVSNIGVTIQLIGGNGSMTSVVTVGVESEPSWTAPGRMVLRSGDLIHIAASDLTTLHSTMVLAGRGVALPASVHLVVSAFPTVEQVPAEPQHQLPKRTDIVTMNVREATALSSILAIHEPGTGIRNLMKPETALARKAGIMECELQRGQGAERIQMPAFETCVADTVRVGDTRIVTICAAFLRGKDIEEACSPASATAATAISRKSAPPVPILKQILCAMKGGKATGLTNQKA